MCQKRLRVGGKALALSFRIKMNAAGIEAVTFRGERLAKITLYGESNQLDETRMFFQLILGPSGQILILGHGISLPFLLAFPALLILIHLSTPFPAYSFLKLRDSLVGKTFSMFFF